MNPSSIVTRELLYQQGKVSMFRVRSESEIHYEVVLSLPNDSGVLGAESHLFAPDWNCRGWTFSKETSGCDDLAQDDAGRHFDYLVRLQNSK